MQELNEQVIRQIKKPCILIGLGTFIILALLNYTRICLEFDAYNSLSSNSNKKELQTIIYEMRQISDSLFENLINTPEVTNIFKKAHNSSDEKKAKVREKLYLQLNDQYKKFTKYGIQQLHFHLPNNDSFLRFHKPQKFGDNLTNIRESVKYVNLHKKPTVGFEEGKIFSGYRFVYPLFDSDNNHIGSVEVSSSLLNFKQTYEKNQGRHLDYILSKSYVKSKVFSSELNNYKPYHGLDNFLVQNNITFYNKKYSPNYELISSFFDDNTIQEKLHTIKPHIFSKIIDWEIYTLEFIPLYNDFLNTRVGYTVIFSKSDYLVYFKHSVLGSSLSVLIFSILVGYLLYVNKKSLLIKHKNKKIKLYNDNLLQSNQLIKSVIDGTDDLIFYKNKDFYYLGCNDAFTKLVNKSKDEILGKTDFELFDEDTAKRLRKLDNLMLQHNQTQEDFEWITYPNGEKVYLNIHNFPFMYDENNTEAIGILNICRDLTELHMVQKRLKEQTYTDELTGISNRKSYNKRISELLSQFQRYETPFSFIMFDIDNFKSINDTFGHDTGDQVLKEISKLIQPTIRKNDYFFRVGGEEFIVLLSKTELEGAKIASENIRHLVETSLDVIENKTITVSIGVTTALKTDDQDSIYKRADNCMYLSKRSGKNMVSYKID